MKIRRIAITTVAAVLPLGLVTVAAAQSASAAGPPNAKGSATCNIVQGAGTVSPGLTPAGSPGGVKITFHATLSNIPGAVGCGGMVKKPAGTVVTGGTLTGSGFYNPPPSSGIGSSCAAFAGADVVGKIKAKITWTTTGPPIAPTKVVYQNNPGTVTGAGVDTIDLKAPPGTAHKTGSFAAPQEQPRLQHHQDGDHPARRLVRSGYVLQLRDHRRHRADVTVPVPSSGP